MKIHMPKEKPTTDCEPPTARTHDAKLFNASGSYKCTSDLEPAPSLFRKFLGVVIGKSGGEHKQKAF